jgi:rhodanese-related sulfurtransferase
MELAKLTPGEVKARMERGERFIFVDARPLEEWNAAENKLPGAVHVPMDGISEHLKEIPWGHPVVSYSGSPHDESSGAVARELTRRGFLNAYSLVGGFEAWCEAGYPVERKQSRRMNRVNPR